MIPSPSQFSHRPPLTLKLKRPGVYPKARASGVWENTSRTQSKTFVYVAGLLRGVRPMGRWSMSITLSRFSSPVSERCLPGTVRESCRCRISAG